jgi:DNA mismatch repair protein MutL
LHERILYEQIRHKLEGSGLSSQKLLVPEPVDLDAAECAAVVEQRSVLAKLGIEIEPFGGDTVLVRSYPSMLANLPPADVISSIARELVASARAPSSVELVDELLHSIACKAAVKYGDRLSADEIQALLAERHLTQNHHHCPHGRPTALVFSCDELDKQFKRI